MDRSRDSITETRKRKATAIDGVGSKRELFPGTASTARRPTTDLGAMLKPAAIPRQKFNTVQAALDEQSSIITERGAEIRNRCAEIHDLKHQLSDAHADTQEHRKRLERKHRQMSDMRRRAKERSDPGNARELRERKEYYENFIEEQNQIIDLGNKLFTKKAELAERLEKENQHLRTTIDERDSTVSALDDQILRLSTTPTNEIAESCTARTLAMVKGLQADIAQRDLEIANYKREKSKFMNATRRTTIRLEAQGKTIAAHSNALEFANEQTAEAKNITEEQAQLVGKLMEENARLAANQKLR